MTLSFAVDLEFSGTGFSLTSVQEVTPTGVTSSSTFDLNTGLLNIPAVKVDLQTASGIDSFYYKAGLQLTGSTFGIQSVQALIQ